jgi:hypothetical protein
MSREGKIEEIEMERCNTIHMLKQVIARENGHNKMSLKERM